MRRDNTASIRYKHNSIQKQILLPLTRKIKYRRVHAFHTFRSTPLHLTVCNHILPNPWRPAYGVRLSPKGLADTVSPSSRSPCHGSVASHPQRFLHTNEDFLAARSGVPLQSQQRKGSHTKIQHLPGLHHRPMCFCDVSYFTIRTYSCSHYPC